MNQYRFCRFLNLFTAEALAREVGVKIRTIYKWRTGKTMPNPRCMVGLVLFAKKKNVKLTYQDIVEFHLSTTKH